MKFDLTNAGVWLSGQGQDTDVVVSTRLRLARNLENFNFKGKLTASNEGSLESFLAPRVVDPGIAKDIQYVQLNALEEMDRLLLLENHLISVEHFNAEGVRGVAFDPSGSVSIMVNEEDHLRIQVIFSGLALEEGWEKIDKIDDLIGAKLNYAFDPNTGFLTSCPTNVGTGLRVSVMLHLPALVLSKHIEKVFNAVAQVNLTVRGFFGEGSQAVGDFYQISNQVTLGLTPEEIVHSLTRVMPKIIEYEREVRKALLQDSRKVMEDKVWRALGMLRTARSIASEECMTHLSNLRLGINLELLDEVTMDTVNQLFLDIQPGHLQKIHDRILKPEERDILRADLIRHRLQENHNS